MKSNLTTPVVVAAAVLAFSAAPGVVGLAAAKDRGGTVRGGGPAATVTRGGPAKQDATGSTSTQTEATDKAKSDLLAKDAQTKDGIMQNLK